MPPTRSRQPPLLTSLAALFAAASVFYSRLAGQVGLALESLMLAEEMVERIAAERRSAREVTIAGEVRRRLLPQRAVSMATLDYAGGCRQAHARRSIAPHSVAPWLCLLLLSCGGGTPVGPSPSLWETLSPTLETAHFRVLAGRATPQTLRLIADGLEANAARIAADLEVTDLRTTTVEVWTDAESFYRDMQATIGRRFDGTAGYVSGPADLAILVGPQASGRNAVHEFAHCVSLRLNPSIGNNPRWLWETVALYENGEFVDPRSIDYLRRRAYPTIAQLDADYATSHQIYDVGYVLGEFITTRWGPSGLVRLVRANGDIERTLGITVAGFEEDWYAFLREKYLGA